MPEVNMKSEEVQDDDLTQEDKREGPRFICKTNVLCPAAQQCTVGLNSCGSN